MDHRIVLAIGIAAACISCNEKQEPEDTREISVCFSLPDVKAGLNADHSRWTWEDGDRIGILNDTDKANLELNPTLSSQTVTVPYAAEHVYGLLPYGASQTSGPSSVSVTVPGEQIQATAGALAGSRVPMAAKASISNGSASLNFHPLAAALSLNIFKTGNFDSSETIQKVTVTPIANTTFAGTATVSLDDSPEYSGGDWEGSGVSVSLGTPCPVCSAKPEDTRAYANQIYLLLGRQNYLGLNFEIETSKATYRIESGASYDCRAYDFLVTNVDLSHCSATIDVEGSIRSLDYIRYTEEDPATLDNPILRDIGTLTEDVIPDFSRVGYKFGDQEIPTLPVVKTLTEDSVWSNTVAGGGIYADSTAYIQAMIDEVGANGGGAILFRNGRYTVSRTLFLDASNIVLRGESTEETILYGAGTRGWTMINIGTSVKTATGSKQFLWNGRAVTLSSFPAAGKGKPFGEYTFYYNTPVGVGYTTGASSKITEDYVPVGRLYVEVKDASIFNVGDDVRICRPHSNEWICDIGMDKIASNGYTRSVTYNSPVSQWNTENWNTGHSRIITAIAGNRLYLDNPIVMSLDKNYGGGSVTKVYRERVSGCGVENLSLDSYFDPSWTQEASMLAGLGKITQYCDEDHVWIGIAIRSAENCWVRNVNSTHIGQGLVSINGGARYVTVDNCHTREPASYISGNRRYGFLLSGEAEMILVKNCSTDLDRHSFAFSAKAAGPSVFLNCTATRNFDGPEPHQRWGTGGLYDNLTCLNTHLYLRDRGNSGNGHGWAGANFVLWNCRCYSIECSEAWSRQNSPEIETHAQGYVFHSDKPSMHNYSIGCTGIKKINSANYNSPYFSKDGYQEDYYKDVLGMASRPDGIWYPEREANTQGAESDRINFNSVPADAAAKSWWPRMSGSLSSFSNPESLYQCQLEDRHARGIWLNNL